jgi:hypothetical protein
MALQDQVSQAAYGLVKQRFSGTSGRALNLAEQLIRRYQQRPTADPSQRAQLNARDPLKAGRARSDPLLAFNWYCDLPAINGTQLSWEFIEEITLPFVEFDQVSNYQAGKMFHYAHHHSIGTLSMKFYEDSQGSTTKYLDEWRRAIISLDSGLYSLPSEYKKVISVTVLDVSKLTVMFLQYTGCWPLRGDPLALISGSSDRVNPSAEFSVDEMRIKIGKFEQGQVPAMVSIIGQDYPPRLSDLPEAFPNVFSSLLFGSSGTTYTPPTPA